MMTSLAPAPRWLEWAAAQAPLLTSWQTFVLVLAIPLIAWGRDVVRSRQERLTVSKVLTDGRPGSLVISHRQKGKKQSSLIVLVGDGDMVPAQWVLERWRP